MKNLVICYLPFLLVDSEFPDAATSAEHLVKVTVLQKDPGALLPGFNHHCLGLGSYFSTGYIWLEGFEPANIWINQRKMGGSMW